MTSEFMQTETKQYTIQQLTDDGDVVSRFDVEAASSEAAARQLREVEDDTSRIEVCLDGQAMNEMAVEYWRKRVRRR